MLLLASGYSCAAQAGKGIQAPDTTIFRHWLLHRHHHRWADTLIHIPFAALPNTFIVRGKALPILFLASGANVALGLECSFGKRHAIGLDAGYTKYSTAHDEYDSASASYKSTPRVASVIRGLVLSYRYYMRLTVRNGLPLRAYVSPFLRLGDERAEPEKDYHGEVIAFLQRERSAGCAYGMMLPYEIKNVCVDLSLGPFWKWKEVHDVSRDYTGAVTTKDYHTNNFGLRIGVNIAWVLKRPG